MKLDRREVARYLGYGKSPLPSEVEALVLQCEGQLSERLRPKSLGRRLPLEALPFDSRDLARHLEHCREAWLTVVTLGSEADRLLRAWSAEHMGKAAVGQAVMAVWMDHCCDAYWRQLEGRLGPGEYLLPPFSPGYGDFDLGWQKDLLDFLDATRRIGVSLTGSGMLVPEKTVTAVGGIATIPTERCINACHACGKDDCVFRKGF